MPEPRFDPGFGGGEWWKKEEPEEEPLAPITPMPVPIPEGPYQPPLPVMPPPQTPAPWAQPPQPIPWAPSGPPAPRQAPPQPVYPQPPPTMPAQAPTLVQLMSQRVAPQIAQPPAPQPRPAYIPTDPSTVLHDLEETPQYTQSLSEIYRQIAQVSPMGGMREHTREAMEQYQLQFWKPIDPTAPVEQLRKQLQEGRARQVADDFMAQRAYAHEEKARTALEEGNYGRAVRQAYLSDAARGLMGVGPIIGYAGEWISGSQRWLEQMTGRYFAPVRWTGGQADFTTATPKELEEASTLMQEQQRRVEEQMPISHRVAYAIAAPFIAKREEQRWNPQGLPVLREPSDLRPYLLARFGDSPRTQLAIAWAESMSWSGAERMLGAAERIYAGEDPLAVVMGHKVNLANPTERDYEVYLDFMEAAEVRGLDREAVARAVQESGYIPGEAQWGRELAGAIWADPLDWGFAALGLLGASPRVRQAIRFWTTKGDDVVDVAKMTDGAAAALAKATNVGQTADDARRSLDVKALLQRLNPMRLEPQAVATRMREPATILATTLSGNVRTADEARAVVTALAEEPGQLARMGLLPEAIANSEAVGKAKPLFAEVVERMGDKKLFPSLATQRFNLAGFADDLATNVAWVADDLAGVGAVKRKDVLFADRVRNTMHDFWMTLNPPYMLRNTGGDIGTIAHDGLLSMHTYQHDADYLSRVGGQTARTLGLREAGPVAGQRGGLADLPYIGGLVQRGRRIIQRGEIIPGKPTIFGEEVRYAKTFAQGHRLADAQWWKGYQLPQEMTEAIGPTNARRLRGALRDALNRQEADLVVREFLSNTMTRFGVDEFLPEGGELSAAMKADLNMRLAKAQTVEDATRILDDARTDVLRHADQTIGAGVTPPMRKVVTSIENDQDVAETLTLGMGAMAKQMGVDDATAVRQAQELQSAIRDAQTAAIDAEMRALRQAREQGLSEAASRAVIMDVRTAIEDKRQVTRATVDRLRNDAWDAYFEAHENGTAIWDKYRQDVAGAWEQLRTQSTDSMNWMDGVINRLADGEPVRDVLPNYQTTQAMATQRYADLYQRLADQDETLRLANADRMTDFDKHLQLHRLGEDTAADWAWRMAIEDPSVDAIDILYSAERDVTELARVARGKHDLALAQVKAGQMPWEDYYKAVDEAWADYWDQAPHRWMLGAAEIADAQGLSEVVTPKAFQDVAKRAGVEIGDLSVIGREGWQGLRDNARRLVEATQNEIMQRTQLRDVRWSGQLDDMIWPVEVDDVARWAGFDDPTEMDAEDWRRVAGMADRQRTKYERMASEIGRKEEVAAISGRQAELRGGTGALAGERITAGALTRKEERELLAELTRSARQEEDRMLAWLLREAGYNEADFGALNLQQRQRLLQELGQGDLLRTPGGTLSQIGAVSGPRREKIIEEMPEQVQRLVSDHFPGTAQDPLQAVSGQWGRMSETAEDWADMLDAGVEIGEERLPQRFYHGDGWPVLRYDRDEIKAILAQVDPLYKQRDEYEQVRKLAAQRYDAWSRVDFDDATRPMSTNWMAATGEQVVAADRASAANGVTHAPRPADLAIAAEKGQLSALDGLQGSLENAWDDVLDARATKLTDAQVGQVRQWYGQEFVPMQNARALVTGQAARAMADFALLDYSNRRAFDTWIATLVPYHYWYTRSARNWAIRFAARPGKLGAYYRYKKWVKQGNQQRQYPSRLQGMIEIPAEGLPEWTGQRVFIDPMRYYWPFQALMNPYEFDDPLQGANVVDTVYRMGRVMGMEPFPHLKVPLMLAGVIDSDPDEIYNFLPQTAPLQAVTALAHAKGIEQIPPGGIYLEAPVRRAFGLVEMEPAGPYRVERAQVSMELDRIRQGDPDKLQYTLMAMELMHNVVSKRVRLGEALGLPLGPVAQKTPGQYVSEAVRRIAGENGWSDADLKIAQEMLAQATQRAAMERGMTSLTGQTGMPAYLYPTGEQRARELQQEQLASRYSPLTGLGSRAEYEDYLQAHPESRLRTLTFPTLPGEAEEEFGPQETLNLLQYNAEGERIEQQYSKQIDAHILANPWNSAGATALRQERGAALADLRTRLMGTEDRADARPGRYDEAKLWSVFGATPEERAKRRNEQTLSVVSGNAPTFEQFTDPDTGEVDYDAWEKAKATYYESLAERFTEHPFVAELAQQAGAADLEAFSREMFAGVTETDVDTYRRRNDTPLEAAQRTWGELYSMAWEAYTKAVEEGEDKGVAYRTYIEGLPAMDARALVPAVQKEYPDRWTDDELRQAYAGLKFPSGDEVHLLRKPQAEQELQRARDEFYQWFSWHVPPGQFEYDMRDAIPLLAAIKDFSTREALEESGFTAEQYRVALEQIQAYMAKQPKQGGDPLEYNFARGMNRIFLQFRENRFPGIGDLLAYRQEKWGGQLSKRAREERDAFDAQHPELEAYRAFEAAYAKEHPVWAQYYKPWLLEEEGEEEGEGEAAAGAGRRGYGGYYGGGAPSRIGSWADFAGMVDVETLTALFRFWGQDVALSGDVRRVLEELHERWGWGEFDEWLAWLQRLYQRAFEGQARDVPGVRYPHWLPGVWQT